MTFEEFCMKFLTERGMLDDQAKAVMEQVKSAEENESMADRWNDDIEEYPQSMMGIVVFAIKHHAIKWIDDNLPKA